MQNLSISIASQSYSVLDLPNRPKALLDKMVAQIYQVDTKRVNEAVNRNIEKFPEDFYFQLTIEEVDILKSQFATLNSKSFNRSRPKAFTWEGCNMLATVLKSKVALERSIEIIRGFTALEKANFDSESIVHGRVIAALAAEMYKNRREIEKLSTQMDWLKEKVTFILGNIQSSFGKPISGTITFEQTKTLRNIVKEKSANKAETMKIWSLFKRKFKVDKYTDLPQEKFDDAVKWLQRLN